MKLIVFGAHGRVGHLIVREAVHRGYEVTAVIYTSDTYNFGDGVRTLRADVHNAEEVAHVLYGQEVVVSALGSWGTPTQDILSSGMEHIIPVMQQHHIKRIISLTGADARTRGDHPSLSAHFMRSLLVLLRPKILKDGEKHIRLLQDSGLDWTVIRSPRMIDGDSQDYVLSRNSAEAWDTVTRSTVATAMLDQVEVVEAIQRAPILHRR